MASNTAKESGKSESMTRTATCMMETTRTIRKTVLDCLSGSQATITKDAIKKMSDTAMEKCSGKMAAVIRASGRKEFKTAPVGCSFQMAASRKVCSRTILSRGPRWIPHRFTN